MNRASYQHHMAFLDTAGACTYMGLAVVENSWKSVLHFHGPLHSAASLMAKAGCTAHEIAAITGHKTLSMVSKYTGQAVQNKLAESAVAKLAGTKPRTKMTNRRIKSD